MKQVILAFVATSSYLNQSFAFTTPATTPNALVNSRLCAEKNDLESSEINPVAKASWYAVETFGKIFAPKDDKKGLTIDQTKPPSSVAETLQRIEEDNSRSYFLSGEVDKLIYDEKCVFSDPFVAFSGRDRFVDNLSNLGSFIIEYDAKMLNYSSSDDGLTVKTRVMVKLELNLPWKPILAWPWGVTYNIDEETFLVKIHEESWDIEPLEGVKQIFRKPTVKIGKSKN